LFGLILARNSLFARIELPGGDGSRQKLIGK
jgi:hypothetical protein